MSGCSIPDCGDPVRARGWCNRHYLRWRNHGDPIAGNKPPAVRKAEDYSDGTRQCTSCGECKPLERFDKDRVASRGRRSKCKDCRSGQMKTWYAENQVRQRDRQRARYADHPDVIRVQDLERYQRNKPMRLDLAKAGSYRRRARLKEVEFDSSVTVNTLRKRDGDLCCYCRIGMSFEVIVDHIYQPRRATIEHRLPLSRGGAHTFANTSLACWECNIRKNARTLDEWEVAGAEVAAEALRSGDPEDLHSSAGEVGA